MSFRKCREMFRLGLIESLARCESRLRELVNGAGGGLFPINGLALRVLPWHRDAWIAFRSASDPAGLDVGQWAYHDLFTDFAYSRPLAEASAYAGAAWSEPPAGRSNSDIAHLVFLAGAEALLDRTVIEKFYTVLGIADNAESFDRWFDYFVLDDDQVFKANYCDVVLANRRTEKALPDWP
jgi:hypothetical protein